ncbi:putative extracellular matrix protein 1-like [Triplophysa rosa]|uniref:Extracellular matrix protein 1-like n=1 Tax=Triplophysa rosa TaxID=992332 RepID=A0A9W7TN57_TRIRA|nr:putative extracellular matrix protein 1-like [Triplophysa rosa]
MVWTSTLFTILILQFISLGGGQNIDPDVQLESSFPPAKPSLTNLNAICLHGSGRARYPASSFPPSGYAYARRAGNAVNRLEAWFSQCCNGDVARGNEQILCCAKQAWEAALSQFCTEEFSTMTLAHECCEQKGEDRWKCFTKQAPNPSYQSLPGYLAPVVPQDRIFTWDPNTC